MSTPTNDGGPAFAIPGIATNWYATMQTGISIRDYFAGQALAGLCSTDELSTEAPEKLAVWSYEQADAMLLARKEATK
jgi:hypothetical protein